MRSTIPIAFTALSLLFVLPNCQDNPPRSGQTSARLGNRGGKDLPEGPPVELALPDYLAELKAFQASPPDWNQGMVNAGWGGGRGAPQRLDGWISEPDNWLLFDYIDRCHDYRSQDWLENRGIFFEFYGSNEYQETIHFEEPLELFSENGIARNLDNQLVVSPDYPDHYIVNNNAPRWSAVINYDWLASAVLGDAISQDNIGGPVSRIGSGSSGRYDDFDSLKFCHHLETTGRLPDFCGQFANVREYVNGTPELRELFEQLPPYVAWPGERPAALGITDDPVMAEYQIFQYASHLHNLMRYYQDNKLLAERAGRAYDVHGNQGGGAAFGAVPYQAVVSDFVDTVWGESSSSHNDIFQHHYSNAWGPFRLVIGEAYARGRKPVMFMSRPPGSGPAELFDHAWAEVSAGGGVLLVDNTAMEDNRPDLIPLMTAHLEFRDQHRAIFERQGRRPHAQIAILYPLASLLFETYVTIFIFNCPASNDMAGAARALEEGHLPFALEILDHPDLGPDRLTLERLLAYRVLVAPSLSRLSDQQAALLGDYLAAGGKLAVLGELGSRDERNQPRSPDTLTDFLDDPELAPQVIQLLDGASFPASRSQDSATSQERSRRVFEAIRDMLDDPLIGPAQPDQPISRRLWIRSWQHQGGLFSAHFVNYDIDYQPPDPIQITPTQPVEILLRLPDEVIAEEAAWLVPGQEPQSLSFQSIPGGLRLTIPAVDIYGVLLVGPAGLDAVESRLKRGDRLLMRARTLGEPLAGIEAVEALRETDPEAYDTAARQFLLDTFQARQEAYLERVLVDMADTADALMAYDFGEQNSSGAWQAVPADLAYDAGRGYGWLESLDPTGATPEEYNYGVAHQYGGDPDIVRTGGVPHWAYNQNRTRPTRRVAYGGRAQRFRIDLPDGLYRIELIQANGSWTNHNFLVSGMTFANDQPVLFDTPLDEGSIEERRFQTEVDQGFLELTFGGPTGWGVAGLKIYPGELADPDPLVEGGVRSFWVSPRYPNPEWYPIDQVRGEPEADLADPPWEDWTEVAAFDQGLPLVDLGYAGDAQPGDVVYAVAPLESPEAASAKLSLGASSWAMAWLNGEQVATLPNLKGVMRDEALVQVPLQAGENLLVIKLQRFWERRWMFYASLTDRIPDCGNGTLDPNETCDPPDTCPTSCDDADPCTTDTLTGSAQDCDATCTNAPITACTHGDGCCPAGCDQSTDDDCPASPDGGPDAGTDAQPDAQPQPDGDNQPDGGNQPDADAGTNQDTGPGRITSSGCSCTSHPVFALPHWLPLLIIPVLLFRRRQSG